MSKSGSATISVNSNKYNIVEREAIISDNPSKSNNTWNLPKCVRGSNCKFWDPPPILRSLDKFPPGAFYSTPPPLPPCNYAQKSRNKQKQGTANISYNARHTSKANANNQKIDDDDNLVLMMMLRYIIEDLKEK